MEDERLPEERGPTGPLSSAPADLPAEFSHRIPRNKMALVFSCQVLESFVTQHQVTDTKLSELSSGILDLGASRSTIGHLEWTSCPFSLPPPCFSRSFSEAQGPLTSVPSPMLFPLLTMCSPVLSNFCSKFKSQFKHPFSQGSCPDAPSQDELLSLVGLSNNCFFVCLSLITCQAFS